MVKTGNLGSDRFDRESKSVKETYMYLTIIPRARMGSESIAHEAEASLAIDSEPIRARGIIIK